MFNSTETSGTGQTQSEQSTGTAQEQSVEPSVISEDFTITGSIESQGSIVVEGKVQGDINCKKIRIGETGVVEGALTAEEIDIFGTVEGTISGAQVSLRQTSKVEADIYHELIELEMGTEFSGVLKRSDSSENQTG